MPFDAQLPAWPAARPLVKWTGGKTAELGEVHRALPEGFSRYLEPFVGGGALLFALPPTISAEANDRSSDLICLYRCMAARNARFLAAIDAIEAAWTAIDRIDLTGPDKELAITVAHAADVLSSFLGHCFPHRAAAAAARSLLRKRRFLARVKEEEARGEDDRHLLHAALKGGLYTALRAAYNDARAGPVRAALFWFLREFCYGGMFRTNASGGFNVPYGGISYNRRSMADRLQQLHAPQTVARLSSVNFHCEDFEVFLDRVEPQAEDFVFLDPPYDSPFSTYDGNAFGREDHRRLAARLADLKASWMLVIAETDFVRALYGQLPCVSVRAFSKLYRGNIMGRVDGRSTHLLITNYKPT